MNKFRKKPVMVEAMQWDASHEAALEWAEEKTADTDRCISVRKGSLFIDTLEGEMEARPGDWIICGVAGELYPCKPDIFGRTYEAVE